MDFSVRIVIALIAVGVVALGIYRMTKRRDRYGINVGAYVCSNCGTALPRVRLPKSLKQAMWGGSTCPSCGAEVDKFGRAGGG